MNPGPAMELGAHYRGNGRCCFLVWAPRAEQVEVRIVAPREQSKKIKMERQERGYHQAFLEGVEPGTLYFYSLNGTKERPDPASRFQPQGVHGPSQVADPSAFPWEDQNWTGRPLEDFIFYELHVGTFTPEGTFDALSPCLDELKELGVTAVELMPVAQFPGNRNWGYDGVYPYAVQNSYGGPEGLKRLVNACHRRGLAVTLDVVNNHLGPEGNYLADFGPYFTDAYQTPWGGALNFDGPESDEVRRFFIENALYWVREFHIDALRLDAVHAIVDSSAETFLEELGARVHKEGVRLRRRVYLIPESARNDARLVQPRAAGGYGLDAQWNDDFHHALHALLTQERTGYYQDFGELRHLVKAFREGYVYSGEYSAFRRRRHGNSSRLIPAQQFVVCAQNHDQVGNHRLGERLSQLCSFEVLKLAAGVVLLSPFLPLLFMGEEYGETAPFPYFVSHADPNLIEAVRKGRREEFAGFGWTGTLPDPQDEATFFRAKLQRERRRQGHQRVLLEFYQELLRLRKQLPALARLSKEEMEVVGVEQEKTLLVRRGCGDAQTFAVFNFSDAQVSPALPVPLGRWRKQLDSAEERWCGSGSAIPDALNSAGEVTLTLHPKAFALFARAEEAAA
ncbi:MAG: malto-oligosyltrehalose trehalohydrolase [Terriglobia bacterium]